MKTFHNAQLTLFNRTSGEAGCRNFHRCAFVQPASNTASHMMATTNKHFHRATLTKRYKDHTH